MSEKNGLGRDIRFVKGIGEAKAGRLASLGIRTVREMIEYYPRAYEDPRCLPSGRNGRSVSGNRYRKSNNCRASRRQAYNEDSCRG